MSGPTLASAGIALKASMEPSGDHAAAAPVWVTSLRIGWTWGRSDGMAEAAPLGVGVGMSPRVLVGPGVAPPPRVGVGADRPGPVVGLPPRAVGVGPTVAGSPEPVVPPEPSGA